MSDQLPYIKADLDKRMHGKKNVPIEFGYCAWLITEVERLRERVSIIDGVEATNRTLLDECKRVNADNERLRRIEDAVIEWTALSADKASQYQTARNLVNVLNASPRPEE